MKSLRGRTGRWTKYGGREYTLVASQYEILAFETRKTWVCQACGQDYPTLIHPMKFEYPKGEYLNVCHICFVDNCTSLFNRLI